MEIPEGEKHMIGIVAIGAVVHQIVREGEVHQGHLEDERGDTKERGMGVDKLSSFDLLLATQSLY